VSTLADPDGHDSPVLGVRPEDIELTADADGPHEFRTAVDVVEPMGDENTVYLEFADVEDGKTFVATISGMRNVEGGQTVVARFPEDAIHLFDRATGEALHNRKLETADVVQPSP